MLSANAIMFLGLGIFSFSLVMEIILIIVYRVNKKKLTKKIYEGYEEL